MIKMITTVFYVGYMRPAPGTWGSLAALPKAWGLWQLGGWQMLALATALVFALGWWATAKDTKGSADHDPSEIVIDEVVGQWIALFPVAYGAQLMEIDISVLWPGWVAAFLLFRAFDITKPLIIGWADRRGDALGVMLDDVIAGLFAAVSVVALAAFFHLVLM